jgi:hypothetical protein
MFIDEVIKLDVPVEELLPESFLLAIDFDLAIASLSSSNFL